VMSWGTLADFEIFGMHVFGILDFTSANILLPLGGLFIVLFVGWYLGASRTKEELSNQGTLKAKYLSLFMFLVKFIAPIAIAMVFLNGIGILKF